MSGKVAALRSALAEGEVDGLLASWAADVRVIAGRERRRLCLPDRVEVRQELEALAWEVVAEMVAEEERGEARSGYSFDAHLVMRLRNRARAFADSEVGGAPAAGMKGALRRGRRIRREMVDNGVSALAAVESLNRGGGGHGGRYRVEDVRVGRAAVELDALDGEALEALTADESVEALMVPEAGWLLAPFEGRAFIEEVVARVAAIDEWAAVIVRAWLGATWVDEEPTVTAVARRLGVTRKRVRSAVELGREVGARLAVELGVEL